jgi:hypothetical protein
MARSILFEVGNDPFQYQNAKEFNDKELNPTLPNIISNVVKKGTKPLQTFAQSVTKKLSPGSEVSKSEPVKTDFSSSEYKGDNTLLNTSKKVVGTNTETNKASTQSPTTVLQTLTGGDKSGDHTNPNAAALRDTVTGGLSTSYNYLKNKISGGDAKPKEEQPITTASPKEQPPTTTTPPKEQPTIASTTPPVKEPGFLDQAGNYLKGIGKQAGDFYGKHSGEVNLGLGAAALGGLGYAAYKKLKNDRAAKKANARMMV